MSTVKEVEEQIQALKAVILTHEEAIAAQKKELRRLASKLGGARKEERKEKRQTQTSEKLKKDFQAACSFAQETRLPHDNGTCNFDSVALFGVRPSELLTLRKAKLPGARESKWMGRKCLLITPPVAGQASRRSHAARQMAEFLRLRGWDTAVYYQMD